MIAFDNSYATLPDRFFVRQAPVPVRAPALVQVNRDLAALLGIDPDWLESPAGVAVLAGNAVPDGAAPLAAAYAGHQFGGFSPQLGDGRAILLGEVVGRDGVRRDIQLKGSGRTPFSRGGDGRAVLGPMLREYIVSEAMHALGLPTTRALAVVTTGETVVREGPLPGAVLTRVAQSHIRVGTFEFFAVRRDTEALRLLVAHAIARHDPAAADAPNPALALLEGTIARQAALIAQWQLVGFIHGVMNTDNMAISGETIDYGPCAFMDAYHPETVYSSIDHGGRYAYANQPHIAQWNLVKLAQCLLPLIDANADAAVEQAQAAIDRFPALFRAAHGVGLCRKIGLPATDDHAQLGHDLLDVMAAQKADFTLTFRGLCAIASAASDADASVRALFDDPSAFDAWAARWRAALAAAAPDDSSRQATMRAANPAFIPRNHQVQAVLSAAEGQGDVAPLRRLLATLARPFDDQPDAIDLTLPPQPHEVVRATFCGT